MESLRDKTLVMIVGPSATGKSTIMTAATQLRDDFSYVKAFTTRAPREGDSGTYTYLTKEQAEELHSRGETVTYVAFPTTGMIYGTTVESYQNTYNLLDTLANSVETYRLLPFDRTVTISLTANADDWRKWFTERYPEPSDEALKRLQEAKLSIEWSLAQDKDHHWLVNQPGQTEAVAKNLIDIVMGVTKEQNTPAYPHEMLELVEKGMWS